MVSEMLLLSIFFLEVTMLKPIKGELYLDYQCDRCASISQVTYKEAIRIGKVMCSCGKILKFAPFKAQLRLDYGNEKPKGKTSSKSVGKAFIGKSPKISRDDVVIALGRMGFKRDEAKRIVALHDDGIMSDESLIQRCLVK